MRTGLRLGDEAERVWRVAAEHVIHLGYPPPSLTGHASVEESFLPSVSAVVFSTPNMILLMERAARGVIEPYLELGEASVGASVHIEHLAGTPIGSEVRGLARVTAIDGHRIDFDVAAYDQHELIGRGTHRRAVVRLDRVARRMAEKSKRLTEIGFPLPLSETPMTDESETNLPSTTIAPLRTSRLDIHGAVATITLNRPDKRNAVNLQMTEEWEQLNDYLARHSEIRVVIVSGAGGTFCAGDDVPEVGSLSLEQAMELSYRQARIYLAWEQLPQVFIAAVDGVALGGGCVAACGCDFRIASHGSQFGMPEILLGWPPGYGIAQLTALIGKSRAMEMCLTGQPISARQALECGLVHRLSASSTLMNEARRWAERLISLPAVALRETKRLIHADEGLQPKTAYLADSAAYIRCLQSEDAKEGIAAFSQKRPPRFSGR